MVILLAFLMREDVEAKRHHTLNAPPPTQQKQKNKAKALRREMKRQMWWGVWASPRLPSGVRCGRKEGSHVHAPTPINAADTPYKKAERTAVMICRSSSPTHHRKGNIPQAHTTLGRSTPKK